MANSLMRAGRLNRRVTIQRPTVTTNSHNERVEGAPTETARWAAVSPAPGVERFGSAERAAEAPMRFVFRYRADLVRVTDTIRFDGRDYAVSSVTEIGTREGLEVLATARGESA